MIEERMAIVQNKNYEFVLTTAYDRYLCDVYTMGGRLVLTFEYDSAAPSHKDWQRVKQQFDADIDALVAAGGTREAMARFVFGNMTEQKSPSGTM